MRKAAQMMSSFITRYGDENTGVHGATETIGYGVCCALNIAIGTLIGMVIRAAMVYLEIDGTRRKMVFGLVLIAAIALTIDRSKLRGVVK